MKQIKTTHKFRDLTLIRKKRIVRQYKDFILCLKRNNKLLLLNDMEFVITTMKAGC